MNFYHLQSFKTKETIDETASYTLDPKIGGILDVVYDYEYIKTKLNLYDLTHSPISHLKYLDFYPIKDRSKIITKGEGGTPLYRLLTLGKMLGLTHLYLKNEGLNPTGVFKDRGTMVEITKAKEMGASAVCVASTGNMAASVSAYAAQAGLPCYVLIPEGTASGKLAQTLSYGARILQIRGTYDDCVRLVRQMADKYHYFLCGDYPFRREGQKSASFEIIEQLGWHAPDVVICPVGFGTNFAAMYKGFVEFKKLGLIDRVPTMIAAQAAGCCPIADGWIRGGRTYTPVLKPQTIAQAVAVGDPMDAPFVFDALKNTGGDAVTIEDEEIMEAQRALGRKEAIFVEPSAALPFAALTRLAHSLKKGEKREWSQKRIVLVATGNGLKDPRAVLKANAAPPSFDADIGEIDRFLKFKLYKLNADVKKSEEERILIPLRKTINPKEVRLLIKQEFDLSLSGAYIQDVFREASMFIKKGKPISRIDLKRILEDTLKERAASKILEFKDFKVETSLTGRPKASVSVRYRGRDYTHSGEGVGPFDAVINAFKQAVKGREDSHCELIDYTVEIDSARTDATVKVTMTMKDDNGNKVLGSGTSPDVIVASVLAYEEAYNLLNV